MISLVVGSRTQYLDVISPAVLCFIGTYINLLITIEWINSADTNVGKRNAHLEKGNNYWQNCMNNF